MKNKLFLICLLILVVGACAANAFSVDSFASKESSMPKKISNEDDDFLDQIERAAFLFFWEQGDSETGMIQDRSVANGVNETREVASIASVGYGLSAFTIAHSRSYHDRAEIESRVEKTLDFILNKLDGYNGFYYHFVNMKTGKREWACELSSIDTAIMINGVLNVKSYFKDNTKIVSMAKQIYERANYTWFYNQTSGFISMGWLPEKGFLEATWSIYCELMMLLLQAIGSPTHPIPVKAWDNFKRDKLTYDGMTYITTDAPLFIHQFSHAWYDFRNLSDKYTNYYENSIIATKVHKAWSIKVLGKQFPQYNDEYWGITASDSKTGYRAWGGPSFKLEPLDDKIDGSVVPCAAAGSIPFLPNDTLKVLKSLKAKYPSAWQRYGFVDAFNPFANWYNPDVIGIDVGITMLMAENYRSEMVWKSFMQNSEVIQSMKLVGLIKSAAASLIVSWTSILLLSLSILFTNHKLY